MLIVDFKAGQLANRLFQFSYFIVHSLEYKYQVINPCFDEYRELFDSTAENKFPDGNISVCYTRYRKIDYCARRTANLLRRKAKNSKGTFLCFVFHSIRESNDQHYSEFDMNDPAFTKMLQQRVVFAEGWNYRNEGLLKKYAEVLRKVFTPKEPYLKKVTSIISAAKKNYDVVIGVHLRKGDYKNFFDGRWYYDDDVFAEKMRAVQRIFMAEGKTCVFITCSNEQIEPTKYAGLALISENREAVVDLYTLAACDYIIGPPSTFTMWASFYGNTPLCVIRQKEQEIRIHDFSVMKGLESFF